MYVFEFTEHVLFKCIAINYLLETILNDISMYTDVFWCLLRKDRKVSRFFKSTLVFTSKALIVKFSEKSFTPSLEKNRVALVFSIYKKREDLYHTKMAHITQIIEGFYLLSHGHTSCT